MVVMILGLCSSFLIPQSGFAGVPVAYAQEDDEAAIEAAIEKLIEEEKAAEIEAEAQKQLDADKAEEDKLVDEILEDEAEEHEKGSYEAYVATIKHVKESPTETANTDELVRKVARMANWSHRLFAPLINFFAYKIGGFLATDYIFEGPMGTMLHKIWIISRNLVNIAFVFILLWMALKEIFYVNKESELKNSLIRFVLILVAVNFSWLGTKVVLDSANVLTHVVFAIPSGISDPPSESASAKEQCKINGPEDPITGTCYPTAIFTPVDSGTAIPLSWEKDNCDKVKASYEDAYNEDKSINPTPKTSGNAAFHRRTSICYENLNLVKYDQNTAVIYLTYGMARIQNLVRTVGTPKIDELAVSVLLSLIIQLAYAVSLLALFLALIVRMAMLWLFVAFSPFLVLMLYFMGGEGKNPFEKLSGKFDLEAFVKWAFVPVKVGAVFAVSFIMISAGQSMGDVNLASFDKLESKSGFVFNILQIDSLFAGMGSLNQFIWLLMSLAVLWMGVFAVLEDMPVLNKATNWIRDKGNYAAKMLATSPYWAPIVPLGKGGKSTSVKAQWQQATQPFKKLIDVYERDTGGSDARKLQKAAGSSASKAAVERAIKSNFTFAPGEAEKFAKAHDLNLSSLVQMDRKSQKETYMKSGASSEQADRIVNAISTANNQQPQSEKGKTPDKSQESIRADERIRMAEREPVAPPAAAPEKPTGGSSTSPIIPPK